MLNDSFGRTLDYLRVSVTDRCNLRCFYCMPPEGIPWKPHENMLSFEEILRVVRIMAGLGVRKIRVTGGEPLLRRGIVSFLKNLKAIPGIEKVTLTTNGLLLGAYLDETETLGNNSLPDGINISLNALDSERYKRIACREDVEPKTILPLIDGLLAKGITVKINCVPVRSFNEEEILPIAALARDKNIAVRFIELMSLGTAAAFQPIPGSETAARIEKAYGNLTPLTEASLRAAIGSVSDGPVSSGPAVYYSLPGFTGKIGFINAVTQGFCETCNSLRLTSEGFLKLCLSSNIGVDLRELIRSGGSDSDIAQAITKAAAKKPRFHSFSEIYGAPEKHADGMSKIGG